MATKQISAKQPTLHDVAKLSGVSYQTVSRVINDGPNISSKTRRRVLEAVEELGYQPNLLARSLKTRRSNILEVVTFGVDTLIPRELMETLGRTANSFGYRVIFSSVVDSNAEGLQSLVHRLNSRACDGILITAPVKSAAFDSLTESHPSAPIVQIRNKQGRIWPSVTIDQQTGSQLATEYLIHLGHREIAEISGPLHWNEAMARHTAFLNTLAANRLSPVAHVESALWMPATGYDAAQQLLASGIRFSAVVAGNDYLALGAILAFTEHGLRIPEDISVIGFDDTPEAAFFRPPLTTVRQDYEALGQQSIQYLLELIKNPDTPVHQRVILPDLIERQSTQAINT